MKRARMRNGVVIPPNRRRIKASPVIDSTKIKTNYTNVKVKLNNLRGMANPRICIKRRLGGIGDVLMTTPLLKALKYHLPQCHITYATDFKYANGALADVINHNPYVDKLISISDVNDSDYDFRADVTQTGLDREKPNTIPPNRIDMFAEAAGVDISLDPRPDYVVTSEEREQAKDTIISLVTDREKKQIIAVQVRSNDVRRTWPLDHVKSLIDLLSKNPNFHVFVFDWGSNIERWTSIEEWKTTSNIHLFMNGTFPDTAAIVEQVDIVVCPDSSMLHLAGALNKKIVTIFGPIPPESRINHYPNATAVLNKLHCSFCFYRPRCSQKPEEKLKCLTGISPEKVLEAIDKKLSEDYKVTDRITMGSNMTNHNQDPIILVRRKTRGIGDVLMITPALAALKKKYPTKEIHVAVPRSTWPVLLNNPVIDKILDSEDFFNPNRYFMSIDISNPCARYESARIRSGRKVQKSRIEIFAEAIGVTDFLESPKPLYYVTEEEKLWAKEFLEKHIDPSKRIVCLSVTSAERYRNLPVDKKLELVNLLLGKFNVIELEQSGGLEVEGLISVIGLDIRLAVSILASSDGLITVDTSMLHFGAALDVPMIALFGPIDYRARCKGYKNVSVLISGMECSPCWRNGDTKCKVANKVDCDSVCMEMIRAKNIAHVANKKFGGKI